MILVNLFVVFFRVGLFAIGGAYSFLPLIEREVVRQHGWLTRKEFLDVLGIVKIFPGAISIKYATYTGYKMAGLPGAIIANIGNFLAPAVLILFASFFYVKYKELPVVKNAFNAIQLVIFAMIIALAFEIVTINQLTHLKSLIIIVLAFALFIYTKAHPALIIIGAGVLGAILK